MYFPSISMNRGTSNSYMKASILVVCSISALGDGVGSVRLWV